MSCHMFCGYDFFNTTRSLNGIWFHCYCGCQLLAMQTAAGIDVNVDGLMRIQIDAAINPGCSTVGDVDMKETLKNSREMAGRCKTWLSLDGGNFRHIGDYMWLLHSTSFIVVDMPSEHERSGDVSFDFIQDGTWWIKKKHSLVYQRYPTIILDATANLYR